MNRRFSISLFQNERDASPQVVTIDWPQFEEGMIEHEPRESKSGPAWSAASYRPGTPRANANVIAVAVAAFDLDRGSTSEFDALWARLDGAGLRYVAHSTHSASEHAPRWRLVVDVTRSMSRDEWLRVFAALVRDFAIPADENAKDAARLMFAPSCPVGANPKVRVRNGVPVDVDRLLTSPEPLAPPACLAPPPEFPEPSAEVLDAARAALRDLGPAIEGEGGDTLTFRACALLVNDFALNEDEAWRLLEEWNRDNQPSWSDSELRTKLANAAAYATGKRGAARAEFEGTPYEREIGRARRELEARTGCGAAARGQAFSLLSTMLDSPEPPVEWLVEGLIARDSVVGIGAEPKAAKTWLALELALAIATGRRAFGEFNVPRAGLVALFMAEDGQASVKTRLNALAAASGAALGGVADRIACLCRGALNLQDLESVAWIVASCRTLPEPPAILVLDPLRDIHGGDENDAGAMSRVMDRLRALRDLIPCSILFIHHSAKQSADSSGRRGGQRLRGSSVVHGAIDGGIYLSDLKGDLQNVWSNSIETEVKGARSAGRFFLRLSVADDVNGAATSAKWEFSRDPFPPTRGDVLRERERQDKILAVLAANDADGGPALSGESIRKRSGIRKSDVLATLSQLRVEGRAFQQGRAGWRSVPAGPAVPGTGVAIGSGVPLPLGREPDRGRTPQSRMAVEARSAPGDAHD